MIEGRGPDRRRDITSPRRDPNNRVSKPGRQEQQQRKPPTQTTVSKFMSEEEQSRRFVAEADDFVLKQAKKKADIRVREGRAKPIDLLAFTLRFVDPDRDTLEDDESDIRLTVPEPTKVIERLNEVQLKELDEDIASFETLEKNVRNREYWTSLRALCKDRRDKLKPQRNEGVGFESADIDKILSPKTFEQLVALEKQIRAKLDSDEPIDTEYWERLLSSLIVWKARAKVKRVYDEVSDVRRQLLGQAATAAAARDVDVGEGSSAPRSATTAASSSKKEEYATIESKMKALAAKAAQGELSQPQNSRFSNTANDDFSQATKALYERELARGISDNEEIFTAEVPDATATKPKWADKYRPRKPRYFNRVQMGYEWNKYNQTHYDHDNPPPKVVQGYKFNIFYPDLIDKTKGPTFKIIREHGRKQGQSAVEAGQQDTCIIRFTAGPPYEDIAFRIVDREWDYSAKRERGFKSTFENGILQLHFQFKRIFYRK